MKDRIQITFQHRAHDTGLLILARREASKLMNHDMRITWCHVVIGTTREHTHDIGGTYVKVLFTVPGCTLVVRHKPGGPWEKDDPRESIAAAFESATHMLDSYNGKQRSRQQAHSVFSQLV
jgi:hypothetical protein